MHILVAAVLTLGFCVRFHQRFAIVTFPESNFTLLACVTVLFKLGYSLKVSFIYCLSCKDLIPVNLPAKVQSREFYVLIENIPDFDSLSLIYFVEFVVLK